MRRYLVPALALALVSVPAEAANVLSNAGFETGALTPWTPSGGPTVTSAQAHTGTYSVAAYGGDSITQTFAAVPTSAITEVSLWALRNGGPFDAYVFSYSDNSTASFTLSDLGASGWNQFNLTSNLAVGKSLTGFSIYGTSPGPTYLDDFVIDATSAVPEPSTWAMMLFGLGAIGFALRKARKNKVVLA